MPSLALSDKKKEEKKMKKKIDLETTTPEQQDSKKKGKKLKLSDSDGEEKKSKKKRKSIDESEEEPEKKSKKVKLSSSVEDVKVDNHNAVSNFRISDPLKAKLKEKGIEALFPIQATTFDMVLDGADLVGRARTGQVKSLVLYLMFCLV